MFIKKNNLKFIKKNNLKSGMILAKDIILNERNINTVLLAKGQVLTNNYINKILYHKIPGVFINSKELNNLCYNEINERLETKALVSLKTFYHEIKHNNGTVSSGTIDVFSCIIKELIKEILVKRELTDSILEFRTHDDYTYRHCLNVANLCITTGIELGLNKQQLYELGMAGLLHDIGKVSVPIEILNKQSALSYEEFELIKTHPLNAVNMLKGLVSKDVSDAIEYHHEKLNGTGYPYGLKKKDIPLYSKILSICDVYHALNSNRPYRKLCFPTEIMEYIMGNAETHFDYNIIKVFLKSVVAFPVGTFVKLSNGKTAIVIKNFKENNMRPMVKIVYPDNTVGENIDLLNDYKYMNITIVSMSYDYEDSN